MHHLLWSTLIMHQTTTSVTQTWQSINYCYWEILTVIRKYPWPTPGGSLAPPTPRLSPEHPSKTNRHDIRHKDIGHKYIRHGIRHKDIYGRHCCTLKLQHTCFWVKYLCATGCWLVAFLCRAHIPTRAPPTRKSKMMTLYRPSCHDDSVTLGSSGCGAGTICPKRLSKRLE